MIVSGLIGGLVAAIVCHVAFRTQRRARLSVDGWRTLYPGWMLHSTIIGCSLFVLLLVYFFAKGGSARPDAAIQNLWAGAFLAGLASAAAAMAWDIYGRTISWKGDEVRLQSWFDRPSVRRLSDVVTTSENQMLGMYRLTFRSGRTLRFSAYLHGAKDLIAALPGNARSKLFDQA